MPATEDRRKDRMLSKIAVRSDVLRPTGMPTTDEDIGMCEDKTPAVLDSCCAVRPGILSPTGTTPTEGSQCIPSNISPGGVRPTRIMADCSNEVVNSSASQVLEASVIVSDEKLPSSDPKI